VGLGWARQAATRCDSLCWDGVGCAELAPQPLGCSEPKLPPLVLLCRFGGANRRAPAAAAGCGSGAAAGDSSDEDEEGAAAAAEAAMLTEEEALIVTNRLHQVGGAWLRHVFVWLALNCYCAPWGSEHQTPHLLASPSAGAASLDAAARQACASYHFNPALHLPPSPASAPQVLRPFMLRRMKETVASELPQKRECLLPGGLVNRSGKETVQLARFSMTHSPWLAGVQHMQLY